MTIGKKLDVGNTAEIYKVDDSKILKLFFSRYKENVVKEEFNKAKLFNDLVDQSAKAYEVVTYNGRYGIIYERIHGESLLNHVLRTRDVDYCAEVLSSLHLKLLSKKSECLSTYKTFLKQYIDSNDIELINQLSTLEESNHLCHGDFHPGNIILSGNSVIVIDYMNICKGPEVYDIARSYFLIGFSQVPKEVENFDEIKALQVRLANVYLKKMNVDFKDIEPYFELIKKTREKELS